MTFPVGLKEAVNYSPSLPVCALLTNALGKCDFLFNLFQVKGKNKGIKYPGFSEPVRKARAGDSDCEELCKDCLCIYCSFYFCFLEIFLHKRVNFKHKRYQLYRMKTQAELNKYYSINLELQIKFKSLGHRKGEKKYF